MRHGKHFLSDAHIASPGGQPRMRVATSQTPSQRQPELVSSTTQIEENVPRWRRGVRRRRCVYSAAAADVVEGGL